MNEKSGRSWPCWRRGVTLVEALLGTALLASLLVSLLAAIGRLERQSAAAAMRIRACRAADGLLEAWWKDLGEFPRAGQGDLGPAGRWRWRTRVVEDAAAEDLGAEIVALEVFARETADGRPSVRVDVLLPKGIDAQGAGSHAG